MNDYYCKEKKKVIDDLLYHHVGADVLVDAEYIRQMLERHGEVLKLFSLDDSLETAHGEQVPVFIGTWEVVLVVEPGETKLMGHIGGERFGAVEK